MERLRVVIFAVLVGVSGALAAGCQTGCFNDSCDPIPRSDWRVDQQPTKHDLGVAQDGTLRVEAR